jgi:hypothetical protein
VSEDSRGGDIADSVVRRCCRVLGWSSLPSRTETSDESSVRFTVMVTLPPDVLTADLCCAAHWCALLPCVLQLVIGRSPVVWASIPDQEVSGRHAALSWSDTHNCWQLVSVLLWEWGGGEVGRGFEMRVWEGMWRHMGMWRTAVMTLHTQDWMKGTSKVVWPGDRDAVEKDVDAPSPDTVH